MPVDELVRDMAWKVPLPPSYYNPSHAVTGQQLALVLRYVSAQLAGYVITW